MKIHRNTLLALLMTLVLTFMALPNTVKADISTEQVVDIYSGTVNGVERTLVSTSTDSGIKTYLKVGDADFKVICDFGAQAVVNNNGIIWIIQPDHNYTLMCWSYDLDPKMNPVSFIGYDSNVESFIVNGSGTQAIAVGYKTFSGEIKSFPTFNDMREIMDADSSTPEPHYIPSSKAPTLPTLAPVPTVEPTVTTEPKVATLSIEKSNSTTTMYQGDTLISKLTLKKGTLTWKRQGKKTKRYKGVKDAGLILKSKNSVFITKKGVAYTVSYKTGKKKRIVKKGAKKILCVKGSAVKIKMVSQKPINIKNK